ncbi:MAG: hypothetical protein ABW043_16730 [Devosia sp.]|uniref:hypothetical protein n=1 Tax=Devosia sp. TaxID=1871048 RepID=UPI003392FF77
MSVQVSQSSFLQATIYPLNFGGILRPTMGGPDQLLNRLGNRFGVTVEVGELSSSSLEGRRLRQQLLQGQTQGVIFTFPQDGGDTGTQGVPRVNGGAQSGNTLVIDGVTPGYNAYEGQAISVSTAAIWYLYTVNAAATANGSGQLTLSITPMLRRSPNDNDIVELETPLIEGFLTSDVSWVYTPGNWQGMSFTIEETR